MTLEIRIFWLIIALGSAGTGAVVLLARRMYPEQMQRMLICFSVGMFSIGASMLLCFERERAGDFLFFVVSYALEVLGLCLVYASMNMLKGKKPSRILLWGGPSVTVVLSVWFTYIQRHLAIEAITINLLIAGMLGMVAWTLTRSEEGYLPLADRLSAAGYGMYALATVCGILDFFIQGSFPSSYQFDQARTLYISVAGVIVEAFLFPLFLLMLSERINRILRVQAMRDPLTNLYNRRAFEEIVDRELACAGRTQTSFSIIVCDLDHFKRVNDQHGHAAGDQVLVAAAKNLRQSLRNEDFLCRWGGDEFCALLPRAREEDALAVAERIRQCFETSTNVPKIEGVRTTVSMGIATSEGSDTNLDKLMQAADAALYQAKLEGRNRFAVSVTVTTERLTEEMIEAEG